MLTTASSRLLRGGLLFWLVWAPLPYGSVGDRSVFFLEIGATALALLAALIVAADPGRFPRSARTAAALAACLAGWMALQLVPWPEAWTRVAMPELAESRAAAASLLGQDVVARSWSLSPPDGMHALWRWLAYVLVACAATIGFSRTRHLILFERVFLLSLGFQAVYGMAEYLSGHQHIWTYAKKFYLGSATGTFVNRNHFASYLALGLPFALALWARRRSEPVRRRDWRDALAASLSRAGWIRAVGFSLAGLAVTAIFLSYSRGGLLAAFVAVSAFAIAGTAGLRRSGRKYGWGWVALFTLPAVWISFKELRAPGERFVTAGAENLTTLGQRIPAWRASFDLWPEAWKTGTGAGTFESAFQSVQPPDVYRHWTHLHNEWIQAGLELGAVGLALVLALAFVIFRRLWRTAPGPGGRRDAFRAALFAALAGAALHAFWDFSPKIPGIGFTIAVLAGLAFSPALDTEEPVPVPHPRAAG